MGYAAPDLSEIGRGVGLINLGVSWHVQKQGITKTGTQPGGSTHRKDKPFLLIGGNFRCLRLGPFKSVRPGAFLPSNPSLGRHHHSSLEAWKPKPRAGKQLILAVLG